MKNRIFLSPPDLSEQSKNLLFEAVESNWIAPKGPKLDAFELDLASKLKTSNTWLALNSGTAALLLALRLLDVSRGDIVLCQSFTFIASAAPIIQLGAEVIFIGSEPNTWNISAAHLEQAIFALKKQGKLPKAIIAVDLYGMPYQKDKVNTVADYHNIPIIEDAAEALGSSFKGEMAGTFGCMSFLSFNGNKIITTSGGGALRTSNLEDRERGLYLSTQAKADKPYYEHEELGYNIRLSNLLAAIGQGELQGIEKKIAAKRENHKFYNEIFKANDLITLFKEPSSLIISNHWLNCIQLNTNFKLTNVDFIHHMEKHDIETRRLWKPLHLQPVFKKSSYFGDRTEEHLFNTGVCLPSGSGLSQDEKARIVIALNEII